MNTSLIFPPSTKGTTLVGKVELNSKIVEFQDPVHTNMKRPSSNTNLKMSQVMDLGRG